MNKKLRLLVTARCPNKCELCCNKQFDLNALPIVNRWDYDEIMITGGEPLIFPIRLLALASAIRNITSISNWHTKIYLYTSIPFAGKISSMLSHFDGIVLTLHKKKDVEAFVNLNTLLFLHKSEITNKSLRLNVFPDMEEELSKYNLDLSLWKVKRIEWLKECPVPEGEDFCRISELW